METKISKITPSAWFSSDSYGQDWIKSEYSEPYRIHKVCLTSDLQKKIEIVSIDSKVPILKTAKFLSFHIKHYIHGYNLVRVPSIYYITLTKAS